MTTTLTTARAVPGAGRTAKTRRVRARLAPGRRDQARGQGTRPAQNRPAGDCLLYTSPSPRDGLLSRMPSSA